MLRYSLSILKSVYCSEYWLYDSMSSLGLRYWGPAEVLRDLILPLCIVYVQDVH